MLSTESVVQAGLGSVKELGLGALSLRSLAERLRVTPMALYRHVQTAADLERAVVEAVLVQVPPVAATGSFGECASIFAQGARSTLTDYPGVARHVLTNWFRLPHALDWIESLLSAADRQGMHGPRAVAAANAIFTYVLMRIEAEEAIRGAGVVKRRLPRGKARTRWPRILANAGEYEVARFDRHFGYGLTALLRGIEGSENGNS